MSVNLPMGEEIEVRFNPKTLGIDSRKKVGFEYFGKSINAFKVKSEFTTFLGVNALLWITIVWFQANLSILFLLSGFWLLKMRWKALEEQNNLNRWANKDVTRIDV